MEKRQSVGAAILTALLCAGLTNNPVKAAATPGGELQILDPTGKPAGACPLKHTDVQANVAGFLGRVTVTQIFYNPLDRKIEAVYVFPLPQDAAVDDMTITVGDRRIVGQIKPREEARQIYDAARAAGHVASLLDQERPNIFTQSVANIEPGVEVTIEISYSETLKYEDGAFEWVFPMVVGPRYIPGQPISKASPEMLENQPHVIREGKPQPLPGAAEPTGPVRQPGAAEPAEPARKPGAAEPAEPARQPSGSPPAKGGLGGVLGPLAPDRSPPTEPDRQPADKPEPLGNGWSSDTDRVPDASRITPPVVKPGFRAGHDISLTLTVDAGLQIGDIECTSHEINKSILNPGAFTVSLKNQAEIPNKDFILRYRPAVTDIGDAVLLQSGQQGHFFTLILQPPRRVQPTQIVPRELIFVLDTSGSMNGFPIDKAKKVMNMAIDAMQPGDTFNVITFSGDTRILWDKPRSNTSANRQEAQQFLNAHTGAGGTEMMKAINAALAGEHDASTVRIVCFMTDGYVGNDFEIIDAVKKNAGTTRVFSFGIGSSVNRFLLDGMARAGRGEVEYVSLESQGDAAAQRFHERILAPVLTDIEIDWGTLPVSEVYPKSIPDLFSSKPIVVCGRLSELKDATVTLRGRTAQGPVKRTISVKGPWGQADGPSASHPMLASLWARAKVDHLMGQDLAAMQQGNFPADLKKQIVDLAMEYRLMTQFTSFVAVEEMTVTVGGEPQKIAVPVELPQGVSYEGIFGGEMARARMMAAASPATVRALSLESRMPAKVFAEKLSRATTTPYDGDGGADEAMTPASKLAEPLRDLAAKVAKNGKNGNLTLGRIKVLAYKVDVIIYLTDTSAATLDALKKLGFTQTGDSKAIKLLIGAIDVRKLEELAKLPAVLKITPAGG